jgi:cytochrome c oxidase subunit 4
MEHHTHPNDGNVHPHIAPLRVYLGVFAALIALTVLTVAVSYVHLGAWNLAVAMIIASIKASLVAMIFMHLKDDTKFNVLVFVGSLLFVGLFYAYTTNDTERRGQLDWANGGKVNPSTGEVAPGGLPSRPDVPKP